MKEWKEKTRKGEGNYRGKEGRLEEWKEDSVVGESGWPGE